MTSQLRFGIISDPHITLPQTMWCHPNRFHLVEWSIPVFESALGHLLDLGIEFLLLPGDLTQHGEPENHQWLADRLGQLPIPAFVIPGNHDVPTIDSLGRFGGFYRNFGYQDPSLLFYNVPLRPGIRLIGLNSNCFDDQAEQLGWLEEEQLAWLESELERHRSDLVWVMIHHNLVPHLPGQERSSLGRRYMLSNWDELLQVLHKYQVRVAFTGHLHVQDVAYHDRYGVYDITTGSTVSFPHPYRLLTYHYGDDPRIGNLQIQSFRVESVPGCENLQHFSREWMGDRSGNFIRKLLTQAPLCLNDRYCDEFLPRLRYLWADIAQGDAKFEFPDLPGEVRQFCEGFTDRPPQDNNCTLAI